MGLSGGAIAGIVIGACVAAVLVGLLGEAGWAAAVLRAPRRLLPPAAAVPPTSSLRSFQAPAGSKHRQQHMYISMAYHNESSVRHISLPASPCPPPPNSDVADVGAAQAAGGSRSIGSRRRIWQAAGAGGCAERQGRPLLLKPGAQLCETVGLLG